MTNMPVPPRGILTVSMFSIYDKKAMTYGNPFYFKHIGEAIRFVQDQLSNKESGLSRHPQDFSIYSLGTLDIVSGEVIGTFPPVFVEEVLKLVEKGGA